MAVQLKLCSEPDIPQISTLGIQSYKEHYLHLWTGEKYAQWYMNRSFSTDSLAAQMKDPAAVFFIVYYNNTPTGFIKLNRDKVLHKSFGKSLELERIYLLQEASGKGVGLQAMQQLIEFARTEQYKIFWLKSMDSSPAVHFYEKAGFKKQGTERLLFEGLKDELRNMFIMQLEL